MSASDFFKKLQPLFESAEAPKQEEPEAAEPVLEGEAAMAQKYAEFLKESNNQQPVIKTYADGTKEWFLNDRLHREDGPAVIRTDGSRYWYLNDKQHREDGPAIVRADGSQLWYLNGRLHREDGPAYIGADGSQRWYLNGERVEPFTTNEENASSESNDDFGLDEEVVTELSPMTVKRTSDKRISNFQNASDKWDEHSADPSIHDTGEDNPFDQEVEDSFAKLQRNHRLAMRSKS